MKNRPNTFEKRKNPKRSPKKVLSLIRTVGVWKRYSDEYNLETTIGQRYDDGYVIGNTKRSVGRNDETSNSFCTKRTFIGRLLRASE